MYKLKTYPGEKFCLTDHLSVTFSLTQSLGSLYPKPPLYHPTPPNLSFPVCREIKRAFHLYRDKNLSYLSLH